LNCLLNPPPEFPVTAEFRRTSSAEHWRVILEHIRVAQPGAPAKMTGKVKHDVPEVRSAEQVRRPVAEHFTNFAVQQWQSMHHFLCSLQV
jgi:hypothetical protein